MAECLQEVSGQLGDDGGQCGVKVLVVAWV